MFSLFKRSYNNIDYPALMAMLEEGKKEMIQMFLYESQSVSYLPSTFIMLAKMKKPSDTGLGLRIHKTYQKGKYELVIFEVPWQQSSAPFLPLILDRKLKKIVGIMLPFNELLPLLTSSEQKKIGELGITWTGFIMESQMGIDLGIRRN